MLQHTFIEMANDRECGSEEAKSVDDMFGHSFVHNTANMFAYILSKGGSTI
jgi:hypothetical protein